LIVRNLRLLLNKRVLRSILDAYVNHDRHSQCIRWSTNLTVLVNTPFSLETMEIGLGLWCLNPRSTIFQLYHDSQFY